MVCFKRAGRYPERREANDLLFLAIKLRPPTYADNDLWAFAIPLTIIRTTAKTYCIDIPI